MSTGAYADHFRDWNHVRSWTAKVLAHLTTARPGAPLPHS